MGVPFAVRPTFSLLSLAVLAVTTPLVAALPAQAFNYPSLQLPKASTRDYTAALTGGTGTTAVFQWREGWSAKRHLQLDVGLSDRKGNQSLLMFAGGYFGSELVTATAEQPLDLLLTGGAGASFGDGFTLFRVPVGVSLGHTFELDQGMSITPYLHPRASLDFCASCSGRGRSRNELSLNFDVGASFQVTRSFALRASGAFSGSDLVGTDDTFALGFTWTPTPLIRERSR
ncbi:MAG: hypothetical protein IT353_21525 [Gemmatimonadaceae bacterium]|nr:hypothetical protein [Gemmatimonadaceae bacterium]